MFFVVVLEREFYFLWRVCFFWSYFMFFVSVFSFFSFSLQTNVLGKCLIAGGLIGHRPLCDSEQVCKFAFVCMCAATCAHMRLRKWEVEAHLYMCKSERERDCVCVSMCMRKSTHA